MQSVHIIITGKVQGVFFRATTKKVADQLRLIGWVRNTASSVEIKAFGDEKGIKEFINWCHKGPRDAQVEEVKVIEIPWEEFMSFSIIR